MSTLAGLLQKSKEYKGELAAIAIVSFVAVVSFGLGRLSKGEVHMPVATLDAGPSISLEETNVIPAQGASAMPVAASGAGSGEVVASKNGEVYHFPWCSGAARMKEENKVYYPSIEAARSAGLRPAANCKGLE